MFVISGLLCLLSELSSIAHYLVCVFPVVLLITSGACNKVVILLYCLTQAYDVIKLLNEVTPPLSAAVPDLLELQYELESKAAKRYATIDIANISSTWMTALCGVTQQSSFSRKGRK